MPQEGQHVSQRALQVSVALNREGAQLDERIRGLQHCTGRMVRDRTTALGTAALQRQGPIRALLVKGGYAALEATAQKTVRAVFEADQAGSRHRAGGIDFCYRHAGPRGGARLLPRNRTVPSKGDANEECWPPHATFFSLAAMADRWHSTRQCQSPE